MNDKEKIIKRKKAREAFKEKIIDNDVEEFARTMEIPLIKKNKLNNHMSEYPENMKKIDVDEHEKITLLKKEEVEEITNTLSSLELEKIHEKVENSKEEIIEEIDKQKNKKKKEKKHLRKGEKIFLLINILVILGIIGYYAYRTVYYYKLSHEVENSLSLKEKLTAMENITYQNDGLYEQNNIYYYKGMDVNNYVYYAGRVFRIIDINNGIRLVEDETSTNLVWGVNTNFYDSLIKKWLDDYLNTLNDYELYLKENTWCNEKIDVNNYSCNNMINAYVGLMSTEDYLKAGGVNSYLNNQTYFWTVNQDMDGKALYVNSEGNINNIDHQKDNYYSYGIRAVITLKDNVLITGGDGTKRHPYTIENIGRALLRENGIGSYVRYNGQVFRILRIEDDGVCLILERNLERLTYSDAQKYLDTEYIKQFNKNDLVKIKYENIEYNYANQYNYQSHNVEKEAYAVMPKVGDLFLNDVANFWLNNHSNKRMGLYYILDSNRMFYADLKDSKRFVRPIIKLNSETVITKGNGLKFNPLIIGEDYVAEN